jgi:hypothetical protein
MVGWLVAPRASRLAPRHVRLLCSLLVLLLLSSPVRPRVSVSAGPLFVTSTPTITVCCTFFCNAPCFDSGYQGLIGGMLADLFPPFNPNFPTRSPAVRYLKTNCPPPQQAGTCLYVSFINVPMFADMGPQGNGVGGYTGPNLAFDMSFSYILFPSGR